MKSLKIYISQNGEKPRLIRIRERGVEYWREGQIDPVAFLIILEAMSNELKKSG